jgi:hypothetical protein
MLRRTLFFSFVCCIFAVVAVAQPTGDVVVEGDDGAKEAAERAQYVSNFHAYNANLNTEIALKKLYHNHIDINRTAAAMPVIGNATQSIDWYYTYEKGQIVPKKALVLTVNGKVSSYQEFVFDFQGDGELSYYSYNSDLNNDKSEKKAGYFEKKQLMYYSVDGLVLPKREYDDKVFQTGIDMLNLSEDFKLIFMTLGRLHSK